MSEQSCLPSVAWMAGLEPLGQGTRHSQDPKLWLVHVSSKVKDYRNMGAFLGVSK